MKSYGVTIQMEPLQQYFHVVLQCNPGNSNSEGKRKTVQVSGGSSYRSQLNIQFATLIIDSLLIF